MEIWQLVYKSEYHCLGLGFYSRCFKDIFWIFTPKFINGNTYSLGWFRILNALNRYFHEIPVGAHDVTLKIFLVLEYPFAARWASRKYYSILHNQVSIEKLVYLKVSILYTYQMDLIAQHAKLKLLTYFQIDFSGSNKFANKFFAYLLTLLYTFHINQYFIYTVGNYLI
jgi:hypothetical protein